MSARWGTPVVCKNTLPFPFSSASESGKRSVDKRRQKAHDDAMTNTPNFITIGGGIAPIVAWAAFTDDGLETYPTEAAAKAASSDGHAFSVVDIPWVEA